MENITFTAVIVFKAEKSVLGAQCGDLIGAQAAHPYAADLYITDNMFC